MTTEEIVTCFKCGGHGTIRKVYNSHTTSNYYPITSNPLNFTTLEKCEMCKGSGKLIKVIEMCYKPLEEYMVIDNVDELNYKVENFIKFEASLKEHLKVYFKNPSISLEDRWDMFEKIGRILPIKTWYMNLKELDDNNLEWYDTFGYEKYSTVEFTEIVLLIDESVNGIFDNVDLNKVKTEILESGYSGFRFDW